MTLRKLYGLNKYLLELSKLFDIDRFPQVILLSGKKGQGKYTLIHHFMSYIFDKKNYDFKTLTIKDNNKLFSDISKNYDPNIFYFNCSDQKVKIEDIRNLREVLQKTTISSSKRFIIFDDVEYLNENCVNALLKTIEEPSSVNYFILINNQNKSILENLKSRSIEVMIFLSNKEKQHIIENITNNHGIERIIDSTNSTLTPGNYLKFNQFVRDEKIDLDDKLVINIVKLLKLSKSKKNIDYLNFAIYLINKYYLSKSKEKLDFSYYNDKRTNIIKKIHEANNLNLNHKNLIAEIENFI